MADVGELLASKYRLIRMIGHGGMGGVFEAQHEQIGKKVAVKFLRPEFAFDSEMVMRFMREARAAAAIGHPCIIDVYDIGSAPDGSLFLVMELLKGKNLGDVLAEQGTVPLPLLSYVTCQVLSALGAAHEKEIVHRDIKPANIFLVDTGQALQDIKLLDFGISKMLDPNRPGSRLTNTGVPVGTPSYMSPEQVLGEKDVDHRADIYGMGVLMYLCLTGTMPFVGDADEGVYYKILKGIFPRPREVRPDIPQDYEQIVLRSMALRREDRFQTASEFLATLYPFVDDRSADRIVLPEGIPRRAQREEPSHSPSLAPVPSGRLSAVPPPRRAGLYWVIAAVVVGFGLLALATALVLVFRPWESGEDVGTGTVSPPPMGTHGPPQPAAPLHGTQPSQPAPQLPAPIKAHPPSQEPATVELLVKVEPAHARIKLDGKLLKGNPFVGELPRSDKAQKLEAYADGYQPVSRDIILDVSRTLNIVLKRRGNRSAKNTQTTSSSPPPPPTSHGKSGAPSKRDPWQAPGMAGNPFGQ